MAKKKIEYKNTNEIEEAKQKVRGERLLSKDKEILPEPILEDTEFGKPDKALGNEFGQGTDEFVELHVYDQNGSHLESVYDNIEWTTKKAPGGKTTQGQQLVLKPGNDLRTAGYKVGKFKVVYNFFTELLGDRLGHNVYIDEISPTRKEIRILPVRKHPKASLDPNSRPFIKENTVYDGTTKYDGNISFLQNIVNARDLAITNQKKAIEHQNERLDHWISQAQTFSLEGRVILKGMNKKGKLVPYDSRVGDEYPNKKYSSVKTRNIIDERVKINDEQLKKLNLSLAKMKEGAQSFGVRLKVLKERQEVVKFLHRDDKQFYYDFFDFSEGNDTDTYTYDKGIIKSVGSIKDRQITIEDGKFQKLFVGGMLEVKNPNSEEIIYKAKISKIKGSKSNPRIAVLDRPYLVNGEPTMLPKSNFTISYQNSRTVNRKDLKNLISFGDNENYVVTNWLKDDITYETFPNSVVVRLYEPLAQNIKVKDKLWLSREVIAPVIENVNLFSSLDEKSGNLLKPPSFDVDEKYIPAGSRPTSYENWNDLLSTQASTKENLINEIFSSSLDSARLNIKYNNYEDFVHFGSAAERLQNFRYKLTLLEDYNKQIAILNNITGSDKSTNNVSIDMESYKQKKNKLLNDFDGYEKHLYYSTQSYSDEGFWSGSGVDTTWPKVSSTSLYHTTSSIADDWFDSQVQSASMYDKVNPDSLFNSLPLHITEDDMNEEFHTFVHMVGQHFDVQWQYIKQLLKNHTSRTDSVTAGMSKDVVYYVAKSFGINVEKGTDARRLWREYFGLDASGSAVAGEASSVGDVISSDDYSKEIWNRLLNNLPYLLKTKGTSRSVKAILACYGIPQTILDIREYGGPPADLTKPSYYYKEEFGYGIKMDNGQYISSSWQAFNPTNRAPDGVEIRFDFPYKGMKSDSTKGTVGKLESSGSWNLIEVSSSDQGYPGGQGNPTWGLLAENVGPTDDNYGKIKFKMKADGDNFFELTSSKLEIFDGQYWSVMVQRTDTSDSILSSEATNSADWNMHLYVGKYDVEAHKVLWSSYTNKLIGNTTTAHENTKESWVAPGTVYIGGSPLGKDNGMGHQFTGSLQEYRLWNGEHISKDTFLKHVGAPKSYTGNEYDSANKYNTVRYSFNQKKNHSLAGYYTESNGRSHLHSVVVDESINTSQDTPGYAVGFGSLPTGQYHYEWEVSENRYEVPAIGSRRPTDKIRLEDNELVHGNLNTKKSVEASSLDSAPLDSNRLGVYFSPTNLLDIDIMREFAGVDLGDYVGAPLDRYRPNYPELDKIRRFYFKKYVDENGKATGNLVYEYLKLIDHYDRSLFNTIIKFLPARANKSVGIAIEPHLLERHRIEWKPLRTEENNYEGAVDIEQYIATDDYIANDGRVNHIEGGIDPDSYYKWAGTHQYAEGGVDPDSYLNFFGEQHTEEGGIDPDSYLNFSGEESYHQGGIDPDSCLLWSGEQSHIEGETAQADYFNFKGETSQLEGSTDQDAGFNLSGTSRRYEGETDAETQIILSGRTPNYEGGTEAETEVDLTGTSRRYEGESKAETEVNLGGDSSVIEGTMLTPLREYFENPLMPTLQAVSWSFVSGSDRGASLREFIRGGEVFGSYPNLPNHKTPFIEHKYVDTGHPSGSYVIETHLTTHPDGAREIDWESGSIEYNNLELEPYQINEYVKDNHEYAFGSYGYIKNKRIIRYKAAESTPIFSTVIARQRFEGMKMVSSPYTWDGENQVVKKFGSGGDSPGMVAKDWMNLSDSKETSDGGPVVVVTETSPTQLVVTTPEQDNTTTTY